MPQLVCKSCILSLNVQPSPQASFQFLHVTLRFLCILHSRSLSLSPTLLISYFYESKTPSLSLNISGKKTGGKNRRTQILEFYSLFSHLPTPHSPFHFSFYEFRLCPTLECVCLIFGEVLCAFILFSKRVSPFLCFSLLHCRCSPGMSWMRIRDRFNSEIPGWKGNKESLIELKSGTCLLQAWSLNQLECVRAPFTLVSWLWNVQKSDFL